MSANIIGELILASGSPRRAFLLNACSIKFSIEPSHVNEDYPEKISPSKVPSYLAERKSLAVKIRNSADTILTADTVVILNHSILNKPVDEQEAIDMLQRLSGQTHEVITAVQIRTIQRVLNIECSSFVSFRDLNKNEITEYVRNFRPLDKAGAYGAQECLPPGYNPCTEEEIQFLKKINKPDLFHRSRATDKQALYAIKQINGSYFNVMGLPIHLLQEHLQAFVHA
jgi:septum formation protein